MKITNKQIITEGNWTDWKLTPDKKEYLCLFVMKIKGKWASFYERVSVGKIRNAFQLLPKEKKEEGNA